MARSPDEIDFEQYYEDWRHRDALTWQIPAVTVAIGSGIMIGSYMAEIPWCVKALAFGLGAFFIASLTVMLAQNLYYQWRDEEHLEDYETQEKLTPQSRPIPPKTKEEEREIEKKCKRKLLVWNRLTRIIGFRRMGSTLLLITCFLFYGGLSYLFGSTWQWCCGLYRALGVIILVGTHCYAIPCGYLCLVLGIIILVGTPALTIGCFLKWLIWDIEKN